jgi:hemoglobin-like flavoprotein
MCVVSGGDDVINSIGGCVQFDALDETDPWITGLAVSARERRLIEKTWEKAKEDGCDSLGANLLQTLLVAEPQVMQLFPFKDEENVYESLRFKAHASKLAVIIDAAVSLLANPVKLESLLISVATSYEYSFKQMLPEHFPLLGEALIRTLTSIVGGTKFTWQAESAWRKVWTIISTVMIGAIRSSPEASIPQIESEVPAK